MAGPFDKINAALNGAQAPRDSNPSNTKIGRSTAEFTRPTKRAEPSMSDHADALHPVTPRKKVVYGGDWDQ